MRELFSLSWNDVHGARVRAAVQQVEKLDGSQLRSPQLGGILEKIVASQNAKIATLNRNGIHANADSIEEDLSDYGRMLTRSHKVLRVMIPITGDPQTLLIHPSSWTIVQGSYELNGNVIILTVSDDDRVDKAVDDFINQVNQNLDGLRQEIARYEGQIMEAVQAAAQRRKTEIDADDQRDKGRSFPVTRRS